MIMSKLEILSKLPTLSLEERREIRAKLNELDGLAESEWDDDSELTDEQKKLIESRIAEHQRSPETAIPWEEFKERLSRRPAR